MKTESSKFSNFKAFVDQYTNILALPLSTVLPYDVTMLTIGSTTQQHTPSLWCNNADYWLYYSATPSLWWNNADYWLYHSAVLPYDVTMLTIGSNTLTACLSQPGCRCACRYCSTQYLPQTHIIIQTVLTALFTCMCHFVSLWRQFRGDRASPLPIDVKGWWVLSVRVTAG